MSFQAGASPTPVAPGFGGTRLATGPKQDANRRWSSSLRLWPRNSSTVCSCQASLIWRSVSASSGRQRSTPPISAPITGCSLVTEIVLIRSAAIATLLSRRQRWLRAIYQAGRHGGALSDPPAYPTERVAQSPYGSDCCAAGFQSSAGEQRRRHGRPSALAVLRLSTISHLVGACTGNSTGFSPLRMRST